MRVFIVHAHPEPRSFNGAMTRAATAALQDAGHEVVVSDLYAMGFNPVSGRHNFTIVSAPDYFRQQAEEAHAAKHDGFAADLQAEMDKLFWCDTLILQFPLWWFGLPAILKGWVDRVFAAGGRIYGGGKWYDRGVFAGKRAMVSATIGGPASMYSEHGLNGPIATILFPIHHGILYFTGFMVVEPFLVYAPARRDDHERAAELNRYRARVLDISSLPTIAYPRLGEYDEQYILRTASSSKRLDDSRQSRNLRGCHQRCCDPRHGSPAGGEEGQCSKRHLEQMHRVDVFEPGVFFRWSRHMDWNRVQGNWKQVKGSVKEKWGQLTDDDLDTINGRREQLEGKIQERYGMARDQVRKDVDDWYSAQGW